MYVTIIVDFMAEFLWTTIYLFIFSTPLFHSIPSYQLVYIIQINVFIYFTDDVSFFQWLNNVAAAVLHCFAVSGVFMWISQVRMWVCVSILEMWAQVCECMCLRLRCICV